MPTLRQDQTTKDWHLTFSGIEIVTLRRALLGYAEGVTNIAWQMMDFVQRTIAPVVVGDASAVRNEGYDEDGGEVSYEPEIDESLSELAEMDEEAEGLSVIDRPRICIQCKMDLTEHMPGSLECWDGGQGLGTFYTPILALLPAATPVYMEAKLKEGMEA
jgi:hypothetical protein